MPEVAQTNVTPSYEIEFGVCVTGRPSSEEMESAEYTTVKDAESLAISINGNVEEWKPMDMKGWMRRLMTGKDLSISMGGKRNYGDPGNDYVASLMMKTGQDCNTVMKITFPNLDVIYMPCVINVTSGGGESTSIGALEWEALSDGKPKYVEHVAA